MKERKEKKRKHVIMEKAVHWLSPPVVPSISVVWSTSSAIISLADFLICPCSSCCRRICRISRSRHILCALHLSWWLTISRRKLELPSANDVRMSGISLAHRRQYKQNIMFFSPSNCNHLNCVNQLGRKRPPLRDIFAALDKVAVTGLGLGDRMTHRWRFCVSKLSDKYVDMLILCWSFSVIWSWGAVDADDTNDPMVDSRDWFIR